MYEFMKKIMSERNFQKQLVNFIMKPISASNVTLSKWILGKNIKPLDVDAPDNLTK